MAAHVATTPRVGTGQATPTSTPKTTRPPGSAPVFKGRPGIIKRGKWDEDNAVWYVEIVWEQLNERWRRKRGVALWTLVRPAPEPHHPEANRTAAGPHAVDAQTGHEPDAEVARGESEEAVESRGDPLASDIDAISLDDALPAEAPEKKGADDAPTREDVDDVVAPLSSIPNKWSSLERFSIHELQFQCQELGLPWEFDNTVNDELTRKTLLIQRIVEKVDFVAALTRRLLSNDLEHFQTSMRTGVMESQIAEISPRTRPEHLLADRISCLSDEQRDILLPILELHVQSAEGTDLLRENLARMVLENEHLRSDNVALRKELATQREDCERREAEARIAAKIPDGGKFMKRHEFRNRLEAAGLLQSSPGSPRDGQDVYHIIATAHGGPDHTDNYLFTLGASFNRSISDKYDTFNLFMAGKNKAQKAVKIALKVANNERLHQYIDKRPNSKQRIFTESVHKKYYVKHPNNAEDLADAMYHDGAAFMIAMRRVARDPDALYTRSFDEMRKLAADLGANYSNDEILQILEREDPGNQS